MSNMIQLSKTDYEYLKRLDEQYSGGPVSLDGVIQMQSRAGGSNNAKALNYQRYISAYDSMKASTDPRVQRAWQAANMEIKDIAPGTVHQNATLTNLSIQYANEAYIGEQLMPVVQVGKESDIYYLYPRGERMQYPDDQLGSRGKATEIDETRTTATYTCLPYGYSNFVAQRTLNNQDSPLDEMVDLVESINEGLAYRRELRIAAIMTATGSFGAGQWTAIGAGDRWDTAGGGDIIDDIQVGRAAIWNGRGPSTVKAYSSLDVFNVVSRHPSILDLFKYNGSSPGLATPDMIARFFGLDSYLVGAARSNTALEGAADVYARVWANVFGMVRVATRPTRRNASFGYTFRHGMPLTSTIFNPQDGHGGGYTAQVSVSETHNVVAAPTGYLITTPIG